MNYLYRYSSPLGTITLVSDGDALTGLVFEGQKYFDDLSGCCHSECELPVFSLTCKWLDEYFSGKNPAFCPPIKFNNSTSFRNDVWNILLSIPYGKTTTYGAIARLLAKQRGVAAMSAQAVGGAVAHNPISIIVPCHRVLGADGSLTGYAGGTERKQHLLQLEGAI